MGTVSSWDGGLRFRPEVPASLLTGSQYDLNVRRRTELDFKFIVEEQCEESTDTEGWQVTRTRKMILGVEPACLSFKGYSMATHIQEFLDFLKIEKRLTPSIYGYIEKITEYGEHSRIYVRDGLTIEVEATITYPGWED